jgi:hypothetical protein
VNKFEKVAKEASETFLNGFDIHWLEADRYLEARTSTSHFITYDPTSREGFRNCPCIDVPRIVDAQTLFVFLHEIGHIAHNEIHKNWPNFDLAHLPLKEEQASCWAREYMMQRGIEVSAALWDKAQLWCAGKHSEDDESGRPKCNFTCTDYIRPQG